MNTKTEANKFVYEPVRFEYGPANSWNVHSFALYVVENEKIKANTQISFETIKKLYLFQRQALKTLHDDLQTQAKQYQTEINRLQKLKRPKKAEQVALAKVLKQKAEHHLLLQQLKTILAEADQQFPIQKDANGQDGLKPTTRLKILEDVCTIKSSFSFTSKKSVTAAELQQATIQLGAMRAFCSIFKRIDIVTNSYILNTNKTEINHADAAKQLRHLAIEAQAMRGIGRPWLKKMGIACLVLTGGILIAGGILALPIAHGASLLPAVVVWAKLGAVSHWIAGLTHLSATSVEVSAITLSMAPVTTGLLGTACFFAGRHGGTARVIHDFAKTKLEEPVKRSKTPWFGNNQAKPSQPEPATNPQKPSGAKKPTATPGTFKPAPTKPISPEWNDEKLPGWLKTPMGWID